MIAISDYLKCTRKNMQLHRNLQEMEQPKSEVKWYCEEGGPKITSGEQEEGNISITGGNIEASIHLDSSDLNFQNFVDQKSPTMTVGLPEASAFPIPHETFLSDCRHLEALDFYFQNSADQENRQLPVMRLGLFESPESPVPQEKFLSETEASSIKTKEFLFEKQHFSETESATNTANEGHSDSLEWNFAAAPSCKNVSLSKFYVDSSDEDSSTASGEQNEHFADPSEEHKLLIRRISNTGFHRKPNNDNKEHAPQHLFDCLLLIGLTVRSNTTKVPYTLLKYPPDANVPPYTENLCFPDAQKWTPSSYEQVYSFVLTSETGQRKFGYCRRVLPEGSPACLPLVYCILTRFRARGFYHSILKELESRHGQPANLLSAFISSLYNSKFPEPGQTLRLVARRSSDEESYNEAFPILRRPHDLRFEEQDLVEMFDILEMPIFFNVFGSILLERKIILISSSFSKLSSCAEAIQSLLYPFSWQHVLISVLPQSLLDVCHSPTPYVVGILDDGDNHLLDALDSFAEGIIVNLDECKVLRKVGDESNILPSISVKPLRASLELIFTKRGTAESSTRNVLISEAFLRMFTDLCGHYRRHILSWNDELLFDRKSFIKSASSTSIRLFLEGFVETAMFSAFIESRLQKGYQEDRFDQRAFERAEVLRKQNKGEKKKTKNLKERFKTWTGNR